MSNIIDVDLIPSWLQKYWNRTNYNNVIAGINEDDCAIIRVNNATEFVITTDFLNANPIAKEFGVASYFDLGKLVVASNLSDLFGTGANPIAFLLGVSINKDTNQDELKNIFAGVKELLNIYGIPLIGGDTKIGNAFSIIGTAIGNTNGTRKLFTKNSAKINDDIWVSGCLGDVGASVYYLSNSNKNQELIKIAKSNLTKTELPFLKSKLIAEKRIGNGGTDVSDGLGDDLISLAESSKVGFKIYADKIPCSSFVTEVAKEFSIQPWLFTFLTGGDFQFIVTTSPKHERELISSGFSKIGKVTPKNMLLNVSGKLFPFPSVGHRDCKGVGFIQEVRDIFNQLRREIS